MKLRFSVLVLALWSSIASAQTSPRDILIDRIVSIYVQKNILSSDSPFLEMILGSAKTANPKVSSDTWLSIKKEVGSSLSNVMTEKGGIMDAPLRKSLESLSDAELEKLGQILGDPAYDKFQAAMASPSTQKVLAQSLFANTLKFNAAINAVLVRHGLKEVH